MPETVSPLAGKTVDPLMLVNVPRLVTAYIRNGTDPGVPEQRVPSAPRGTVVRRLKTPSTRRIFWRSPGHLRSPEPAAHRWSAVLGMDTHALSEPAFVSALEVFAANGVEAMVDADGGYTPTPVISHAILTYNRGRTAARPTGSSSPLRTIRPRMEGSSTTRQTEARRIPRLRTGSSSVRNHCLKLTRGRAGFPYASAQSPLPPRHDYIGPYVTDLATSSTWMRSARPAEDRSRSAGRRRRPLLATDHRALPPRVTVVTIRSTRPSGL